MTLLGLSPLALAVLVAAAAAALFVLHHLRVRPETRRVPTLLFWKEAVEETRARTLFGRFRHPRTYLFLTALAALVALALAEPETASGRAATRHVVLVLDNGAALSARAGTAATATPQFAAVRESAVRFLDGLSLRDRVAVLTTEPGAGPVADRGEPRCVTRDRVSTLAVGSGVGDLAGALARATAWLAGKSRPQVVLFTGPDLPGDLAVQERGGGEWRIGIEDVPLAVVRHGSGVPDRGIVGVAYGETLEIRVAHAGSATPFSIEVARSEGGEPVAVVPVDPSGPAATIRVAVPGIGADGDLVVVRLRPGDRFPHNDRAVYRLPLRRVRRVDLDPALPPPAVLLVREHPWLAIAAAGESAELRFTAGEGEAEALPAGLIPEAAEEPAVLRDGAKRPELPRLGTGVRPLRPVPSGTPLLAANGRALVRFRPGSPGTLEIAPGLLGARSPYSRDPVAIAYFAELLERLAGNRPGALPVPEAAPALLLAEPSAAVEIRDAAGRRLTGPEGLLRVRDLAPGLWTIREGNREDDLAVHPDRILVSETPAADDPWPETPASSPRGWEWLVLVVLVLVMIDAWLHLRGRIP